MEVTLMAFSLMVQTNTQDHLPLFHKPQQAVAPTYLQENPAEQTKRRMAQVGQQGVGLHVCQKASLPGSVPKAQYGQIVFHLNLSYAKQENILSLKNNILRLCYLF